jgi:hypothetical protein
MARTRLAYRAEAARQNEEIRTLFKGWAESGRTEAV